MKKYFYIDDELDVIKSIADGINESQIVNVNVFDLSKYKEFDKLTDQLRSEWDNFDGLILDLKLNGGGVDNIKFSATSLAQWISSYIVEEHKVAKPIILLSNDLQCARYKEDFTSHDLFDMVLERNIDINWNEFAKLLVNIADGYDLLNRDWTKNLKGILQYDAIDSSAVYFEPFMNSETFNVRQFSSFVLNDLFSHPGLLISEAMLASRFGVDMEKSGENWKQFKNKYLDIARYRGVFCQIEERYWSKKAQDVFYELSGGNGAASMTTAQRVDALKARIMDEIVQSLEAYVPEDKDSSCYCWTIDDVSKKPLDASEGYMMKEENGLKSWQEPRFLSFDTLESGKISDNELTSSEKIRYQEDLAAI